MSHPFISRELKKMKETYDAPAQRIYMFPEGVVNKHLLISALGALHTRSYGSSLLIINEA